MNKEQLATLKLKKELKDITDKEIQQAGRLSKSDWDKKRALEAIGKLYVNLGIAQKGKKKNDVAEITNLDIFKKRYSWMLIAFTAIKDLFGVIGRDSKIANTIFDLIGQAVGFIVDMLLIDFLPIFITFVEWLFGVGEWVSRLPTWVKGVIIIVGALAIALAAIFAVAITTGIATLGLSILGIGTAGTTAAGGLGTLLASTIALYAPAVLFGLGLLAAALGSLVITAGLIALAEKYFGVLTKISDLGSDFRKTGAGGAARDYFSTGGGGIVGMIGENVLNPMLSAAGAGQLLTQEQMVKRLATGVAYDPTEMQALEGHFAGTGTEVGYSASEGYFGQGKTAGGDTYHITISGTYKNEEEVYQKFIEKLSRESNKKVVR
jgi:hypothetical protein